MSTIFVKLTPACGYKSKSMFLLYVNCNMIQFNFASDLDKLSMCAMNRGCARQSLQAHFAFKYYLFSSLLPTFWWFDLNEWQLTLTGMEQEKKYQGSLTLRKIWFKLRNYKQHEIDAQYKKINDNEFNTLLRQPN